MNCAANTALAKSAGEAKKSLLKIAKIDSN
jgi:hypothetical protein